MSKKWYGTQYPSRLKDITGSWKTIKLILFMMLLSVVFSCQEDLDALMSTNKCEKCNLIRANLSFADLDGAEFDGANLNEAFLSDANLKNTNLNNANLTYADLTDAKHAKLNGATLCDTKMPDEKKNNSGCKQ